MVGLTTVDYSQNNWTPMYLGYSMWYVKENIEINSCGIAKNWKGS